jgi:putative peptidoglycan lipid II flippase
VFLGISSVLGGILQTKRRFFVYALAPVMYNVGIILGTLLLAPTMGIRGAAVGVAFGAFAHLITQAIACGSVGFRFRFRWKPKDEGVVAIAKMTLPRVVALAVGQINLFILVGMASTIGTGSIAVFTLATNLQNFPVGILGVSFAVAAFPLISELAAKGKHEELVAQFTRTVRTVLFLVVPATVLMLLLRAQIVRVILGSGRFDWNDTIDTANTLAWLTMSLFAQALYPLVVRVFFALKDVKTPLYVSVVTVVIERVLAWYLIKHGYGTPGLAAAFSIASIFDVTVLWVMLKHRIGSLGENGIIKALFQISVAGFAMAAVIQVVKGVLSTIVNMQTFVGILTQGAVAGVIGLAVYLAVAYALGLREAREVRKIYRRRAQVTPSSNIVQEEDNINVE